MENLVKEIRNTNAYKNVRKNSFLWSILKFFVNDVVIRLAKDLIDDGKLNGSSK